MQPIARVLKLQDCLSLTPVATLASHSYRASSLQRHSTLQQIMGNTNGSCFSVPKELPSVNKPPNYNPNQRPTTPSKQKSKVLAQQNDNNGHHKKTPNKTPKKSNKENHKQAIQKGQVLKSIVQEKLEVDSHIVHYNQNELKCEVHFQKPLQRRVQDYGGHQARSQPAMAIPDSASIKSGTRTDILNFQNRKILQIIDYSKINVKIDNPAEHFHYSFKGRSEREELPEVTPIKILQEQYMVEDEGTIQQICSLIALSPMPQF